jgi:hypothetical protein
MCWYHCLIFQSHSLNGAPLMEVIKTFDPECFREGKSLNGAPLMEVIKTFKNTSLEIVSSFEWGTAYGDAGPD